MYSNSFNIILQSVPRSPMWSGLLSISPYEWFISPFPVCHLAKSMNCESPHAISSSPYNFPLSPNILLSALFLNTLDYEEFCCYITPFRRNMFPPSSGSKKKPTKKPAWKQVPYRAGFLLRIFFDPEDGDDMFFRNFGRLSTDYTGLHPRRQNVS
jgi:hypothetical protein